ncbi:patatin-like phospholipase family protein [Flectobacillus roseus]|uniref:Patatin-like phospholipase family protein n=1 Tax=Flectobacillus roseus TaxID=502259 RepID=A0ABT6Y5U7_9BACT|nr:patatin-like phospholipase family protein [Flectobacillus roseus]MDI9858948.1 patatin-like phospholipase family protein [Flectobacillus roseus]
MTTWGKLEHRFGSEQKRKILALDGGGIRGVLTLEILLELENQLRESLGGNSDFRLCDFFDYIGGTSTGAIIAAGLSRGMSVSELLRFYEEKGEAMFDKSFLLKKVKHFYNDGPLLKELKKTFGEGNIDLATGDFKSLLLVVTMNRTTDSPWPVTNNPFAKYNHPSRPDCNLKIPLYQLVRASTAAPAYFKPETLQWDSNNPEKTFVFVDGGVTPYNNPAFLMYRMATQPAYNLNWKTGEKELLIVSVGTGSCPIPGVYNNVIKVVKKLHNNLMYAMQVEQDTICRTVGRCIFGESIDRELGDMIPRDNNGNELTLDVDLGKSFSYVRYNADISQTGLNTIGLGHIDSDKVSKLDSTKNISDLKQIGRIVGSTQVKVSSQFKHFIPQK